MDVYQCPECELRFRNGSEMEAHLRTDHPSFEIKRSGLDDFLASEAHHRRHEHEKRYRPREDG